MAYPSRQKAQLYIALNRMCISVCDASHSMTQEIRHSGWLDFLVRYTGSVASLCSLFSSVLVFSVTSSLLSYILPQYMTCMFNTIIVFPENEVFWEYYVFAPVPLPPAPPPLVCALQQANAWTKHYKTLCVHLLIPKVVPYCFWTSWTPPLL